MQLKLCYNTEIVATAAESPVEVGVGFAGYIDDYSRRRDKLKAFDVAVPY